MSGRFHVTGALAGLRPEHNSWEPEDLTALLDLISTGELKVPIHHTYPLTESQEALRVIEEREVIGKVIVAP